MAAPDALETHVPLAQARTALAAGAWALVRTRSLDVLALDPENAEARRLLAAADRRADLETAPRAPENRLVFARDAQTGKVFELRRETRLDLAAAVVSAVYLLSAFLFFIWMTVDTLLRRNSLLDWLGYPEGSLEGDGYRLLATAALAGALGGVVDAIRSFISWHSERQAYGARFIWKDLGMPWIGGVIGSLAYVVVRSGAGVVNGDFTPDESGGVSILSAAALAFLGGFSSRQVFKWLDARANNIFAVESAAAGEAPQPSPSPAETPAGDGA